MSISPRIITFDDPIVPLELSAATGSYKWKQVLKELVFIPNEQLSEEESLWLTNQVWYDSFKTIAGGLSPLLNTVITSLRAWGTTLWEYCDNQDIWASKLSYLLNLRLKIQIRLIGDQKHLIFIAYEQGVVLGENTQVMTFDNHTIGYKDLTQWLLEKRSSLILIPNNQLTASERQWLTDLSLTASFQVLSGGFTPFINATVTCLNAWGTTLWTSCANQGLRATKLTYLRSLQLEMQINILGDQKHLVIKAFDKKTEIGQITLILLIENDAINYIALEQWRHKERSRLLIIPNNQLSSKERQWLTSQTWSDRLLFSDVRFTPFLNAKNRSLNAWTSKLWENCADKDIWQNKSTYLQSLYLKNQISLVDDLKYLVITAYDQEALLGQKVQVILINNGLIRFKNLDKWMFDERSRLITIPNDQLTGSEQRWFIKHSWVADFNYQLYRIFPFKKSSLSLRAFGSKLWKSCTNKNAWSDKSAYLKSLYLDLYILLISEDKVLVINAINHSNKILSRIFFTIHLNGDKIEYVSLEESYLGQIKVPKRHLQPFKSIGHSNYNLQSSRLPNRRLTMLDHFNLLLKGHNRFHTDPVNVTDLNVLLLSSNHDKPVVPLQGVSITAIVRYGLFANLRDLEHSLTNKTKNNGVGASDAITNYDPEITIVTEKDILDRFSAFATLLTPQEQASLNRLLLAALGDIENLNLVKKFLDPLKALHKAYNANRLQSFRAAISKRHLQLRSLINLKTFQRYNANQSIGRPTSEEVKHLAELSNSLDLLMRNMSPREYLAILNKRSTKLTPEQKSKIRYNLEPGKLIRKIRLSLMKLDPVLERKLTEDAEL